MGTRREGMSFSSPLNGRSFTRASLQLSTKLFQDTMDSLNSILASAHDPYKHIGYTVVSILTLYINTLFVKSHYQKVRILHPFSSSVADADTYDCSGCWSLTRSSIAQIEKSSTPSDSISSIPLVRPTYLYVFLCLKPLDHFTDSTVGQQLELECY